MARHFGGSPYSDSLSDSSKLRLQNWRWSEPICTIQPHSTEEAWSPPEPSSVPPIRISSCRSRSFAAPR
jgi:hypothetical protein